MPPLVNKGVQPRRLSQPAKEKDKGILEKFVPAFVGFWAVGYSLLAYVETSGTTGLGDIGGYLGAGFAVLLLLVLVGVAVYETFKPEE